MAGQSGQKNDINVAPPVALAAATPANTVNITLVNRQVVDPFIVDQACIDLALTFTPGSSAAFTIPNEAALADLFNSVVPSVNVSSTKYPQLVQPMSLYQLFTIIRGATGNWDPARYGLPPLGITIAAAAAHTFVVRVPIEFCFSENRLLNRMFSPSYAAIKDAVITLVQAAGSSFTVTLNSVAFTVTGTYAIRIVGNYSKRLRHVPTIEYFTMIQSGQNQAYLPPAMYVFMAENQVPSAVTSNFGLQMTVDGGQVYATNDFNPLSRAKEFVRSQPEFQNSAAAALASALPFIPLCETSQQCDPEDVTISNAAEGIQMIFQAGYSATPTTYGCRLIPLSASSKPAGMTTGVPFDLRRISGDRLVDIAPAFAPFIGMEQG